MATSSILTNFTITDKNAAERFADALEAASQTPLKKSSAPTAKQLRSPEAIKELLAKRNRKNGRL